MASYIDYKPISIIGQALFNFSQGLGTAEHRYQGSIRLSVSDPFTITQSRNLGASDYVYTQLPLAIRPWTASQIADVNAIATGFSQIAGLSFEPTLSYSKLNPAQIGTTSDINISFIHRSNLGTVAGVSGLFSDFGDTESFKYIGAAGDIVLNSMSLGDLSGATVLSLGSTGSAGFTLLHEIGHSLGMSHPHIAVLPNGTRVLATNFSQTAFVGFQDLGFTLNRIADMDKSYFTIMSYHQTLTSGGQAYFPQNPMILDVISLQEAYGVGAGTTGTSNDTITPGSQGIVNSHRTYFDTGGTDTIDLQNYTSGSYLHMGTTIVGASYQVGISVNASDAARMALGSDLESVRWYYGDFENTAGGTGADRIVGNSNGNIIRGNGGNDDIDGGLGSDEVAFNGQRSEYFIQKSGVKYSISDSVANRDGKDQVVNVESLRFSDKTVVSPTSLDPIGVSIADQLSVVYFGRGISFDWRNLTATVVSNGPSNAILDAFYSTALKDGAFSDVDSLQSIANKTFLNIFGTPALTFEQDAWAMAVSSGSVSRSALPWVMFVSYLGATNVPSTYQVPAQSRIVAVNAFTNELQGTAEKSLGAIGGSAAELGRVWLSSIRLQSDAAAKVSSAAADVALFSSASKSQLEIPLDLIGILPSTEGLVF
jgi:hypothetical protein